MEEGLIIKFILEILAVIALSVSLKQEFKKKKRIFYKGFLAALILAIGIFGTIDIVDSYSSSKQDKKDLIDAAKGEGKNTRDAVKEGQDQTAKKLDQGFGKTGTKIDSGLSSVGSKIKSRPIPYALLDFSIGERNPYLDKSDKGEKTTLHVKLTNWGTGFAYNISGTIHAVDQSEHGLYLANIPRKSAINRRISIPPDRSFHAPFVKDFDEIQVRKDSAFICLKFDFTDSTKRKKSIYRVYYLDKNLSLSPAIDEDEEKIEKFLVENKYWRPPFRQ